MILKVSLGGFESKFSEGFLAVSFLTFVDGWCFIKTVTAFWYLSEEKFFVYGWPSPLSIWNGLRRNHSQVMLTVAGLLFKTHQIFPKILLFRLCRVKSLPCLQFQPGLKPSRVTSKQKWCHCHINRELVCSVFQPGLW